MNESGMVNVDTVLEAAFDRALNGSSADLVEVVLARIRRRQRLRLLVLGVVGVIAAAITLVNVAPLLASLGTVLAGLALPAWHPGLPAMVLVGAAGIFAGWLALEESV